MKFNEKRPLYKLAEIAARLRAKDGCPWDIEQSNESLKPYLIEEAYEVYDAIDNKNDKNLKEELGDLLYLIFSHTQIKKEDEIFDIDDVAAGVIEKLIRRHPHVFGEESIKNSEEVSDRWEQIKKSEKSKEESILDGVPKNLPSLLKAYRIQEKVSRIGFEWEKVSGAIEKLDEEIAELKEALEKNNKDMIVEEAGDMLFSIVNILRYIKVNPEEALNGTTKKFTKRFKYIEKSVSKSGKNMEDMTLKELDLLWEESKLD